MPEIMHEPTGPEMPDEEPVEPSLPSRTSFFSTAYSSAALLPEPAEAGADGAAPANAKPEDPDLPWLRINWEIKALVPIALVLLGGMLLFLLATLSWRDPERHMVLLVAGAGAVAICGALLVVLTYTVQRPMVELQQKIAQLGGGDLNVSVSFAQPQRRNRRPRPQLQPDGLAAPREPERNRAPAPHADVARRTPGDSSERWPPD